VKIVLTAYQVLFTFRYFVTSCYIVLMAMIQKQRLKKEREEKGTITPPHALL